MCSTRWRTLGFGSEIRAQRGIGPDLGRSGIFLTHRNAMTMSRLAGTILNCSRVAGEVPIMKSRCLPSILIFVAVCVVSPSAQEGPPRPLYTIDLSSLEPERSASLANGSVTFLTDHTLVVGMCFKAQCNLQTFELSGGGPRQIGQANDIDRYHAIFRSGDGGVVLGGVTRTREKGAVLLDPGLHTSRWIPKSPRASVLGEKIAEGQGRLLAHTTSLAAYVDHGTLRIQSIDGKLLGSFGGDPSVEHSTAPISFLGQDRILFKGSRRPEIRDFNGKVLRKLEKPDRALGEITKQSEDGARLLYDSFTRRVRPAQTIKEDALVAATHGLSSDGDVPNGEVVRVIDTGSGRPCFEWYGKEKLLPPFGDHADVDPSGRLVAIMTEGTLAIFGLPVTCATK
jgi:hypothetical protein